jgi:hypothetical protein
MRFAHMLALLPAVAADCSAGRIAVFDFEGELVRSNLGGEGGRCNEPGRCVELQNASTPRELYLRSVGKLSDGTQIDLRITNRSEYRAWNAALNGIRSSSVLSGGNNSTINTTTPASDKGAFGSVNLLGPRAAGSPRFWRSTMTYVVLRFEFLDADGSTLTLARTHFSFCARAPQR